MEYKEKYFNWLNNSLIDNDTKNELLSIEKNENEIKERFYNDLEFGTGGLRGIVGAGTNRMNKYTVGIVTQGLSEYINNNVKGDKKVAIAYDSRNMSDVFARLSAEILAANGIQVHIFGSLRSTPELSFAVRQLKCTAGIVITASHNPAEYNGYKVYWDYGCQLLPERAEALIEEIKKKKLEDIKTITYLQGMNINKIIEINNDIDDLFISNVIKSSLSENVNKDIQIVYTPLNGAGNVPVRRVLKEKGYNNVYVVEEQEKPDPDFTTVKYPNPEELAAFDLAIKKAVMINADIIIATDPDCDRLGLVVKDSDSRYIMLNGNQVGALLMNYILLMHINNNTMPKNPFVIKTIVTSELGRKVAEYYGAECIETLTGFKYIGEVIEKYSLENHKNYIFGYEESIGYLIGKYVRDKDAVTAALITCEMAAYYNKIGKNLCQVLDEIYNDHGYYVDKTTSIYMEGIEGLAKIQAIMEYFRNNQLCSVDGFEIIKFSDYEKLITKDYRNLKHNKIDDYTSNVLKYYLEDGSWFVLRPSGTEPKIKIYFSIAAICKEEAEEKYRRISGRVFDIINNI